MFALHNIIMTGACMAHYAEHARSFLHPVTNRAARTWERAHTVVRHIPHRRERPPESTVLPQLEYALYDRTDERIARSEAECLRAVATKAALQEGETAPDVGTTAVVVGPGGAAGVVSAGMLEVFQEHSLINGFDAIIGVSAGAANAACIIGSRERAGVHTYTDKLAGKNGLFKHGTWRPGGLDIDFLREYLTGDDGIDPEKIRTARPKLKVGVVDDTGRRILRDLSQADDKEIVDEIVTSCSAPYLVRRKTPQADETTLQYVPRTDGGLKGLPLEEVVDEFDNIVVMLNYPLDYMLTARDFSLLERLWVTRNTRDYSAAVREILMKRNEHAVKSLMPLFEHPEKNFVLLAPETMYVDIATSSSSKLKKGGDEGRRVAEQLLAPVTSLHLS